MRVLQSLMTGFSLPDVDLLMAPQPHLLSLFLTRYSQMDVERPDTLPVDWNQWKFLYSLPPPGGSIASPGVQASALVFRESSAHCTIVGGSTIMQSYFVGVPSTSSQAQCFWVSGIDGRGCPCASSSLSWFSFPQLVKDILEVIRAFPRISIILVGWPSDASCKSILLSSCILWDIHYYLGLKLMTIKVYVVELKDPLLCGFCCPWSLG